MHPLVASASEAGLQPDIASSVQGIAVRLDVELEGVNALDLDEVRDLARRIDAAYGASGRRADGWRASALGLLAARERELLAGSDELPNINTGTDGARLPGSSVGAKAGLRERSYGERTGVRRHR